MQYVNLAVRAGTCDPGAHRRTPVRRAPDDVRRLQRPEQPRRRGPRLLPGRAGQTSRSALRADVRRGAHPHADGLCDSRARSACGRPPGRPGATGRSGASWRTRRRARIRRRLRPIRGLVKRVRGRFTRSGPRPGPGAAAGGHARAEQFDAVVAQAAARQLRDLRHLRRLVPAEARVVFGLQPAAWSTAKEWTPEEVELFEVLDQIQPLRWKRLKHLLRAAAAAAAAATLEQGCGARPAFPFVDLSRGDYGAAGASSTACT